MNIDLIRNQILTKFGTYSKCAEALNISPSTLSRLLQKPSYKFLVRLRELGIEIDQSKIQFLISQESVIPVVKDQEDGYLDISLLKRKLEICLEENKLLKAEIYDLKKLLRDKNDKNN